MGLCPVPPPPPLSLIKWPEVPSTSRGPDLLRARAHGSQAGVPLCGLWLVTPAALPCPVGPKMHIFFILPRCFFVLESP